MIIVQQEKDWTGRKLTPLQEEALEAVVATNGGGVSYRHYPKRVWQALLNRGLAQGKLGEGSTVVHTRAGLEYIRAKRKQQTINEG